MKNFFTLTLCFLTLSLTAQDDCLGPDFNSDGVIGAADLIVFLTYYGNEWPLSAEFVCGDTINHYDYNYPTVQVGDQCWFAENLRYLPQVDLPDDGSITEPRFYVYYNFDETIDDAIEMTNYVNYGVLYNFPAVVSAEICPQGWHVPTDTEWDEVIDLYGGEWIASSALRAESWFLGSNESGLSCLPGGMRYSLGNYALAGNGGYYWTSTSSGFTDEAWNRYMYPSIELNWVDRSSNSYEVGFSARCIKD